MDKILTGYSRFTCDVFPTQHELYETLADKGQKPEALMISCSDSRAPAELITQTGPGDLFVCRNAGNIVPPGGLAPGGVSATIEYAIAALGVRHIIVMGHSDCGAMKGILHPDKVQTLPAVASWLKHGDAARARIDNLYPDDMSETDRTAALAQENVAQQIVHLQTHPSVARSLAAGEMTLHGWFFDIRSGQVLALDGESDTFAPLDPKAPTAAVRPVNRPRASVTPPSRLAAE